jgi:accessory gene regulator B
VTEMEKAANKLSERIAFHLHYDDEKKAVIEYGLLAVFNIAVIGLVISCVGLVFGFWYECAVIFLSVGILKKSTGGAHAETMSGCVVISVISITALAAAARYALGFPIGVCVNAGITLAVFVLCFIVFYKSVPADTPNKPIKKPGKIRRLRRQSFILLGLYTVLAAAAMLIAPSRARFRSIAFCIRLALLWQTFMLTTYGRRFIRFLTKFNVKEVKL